jgi:hypothetical protein
MELDVSLDVYIPFDDEWFGTLKWSWSGTGTLTLHFSIVGGIMVKFYRIGSGVGMKWKWSWNELEVELE